MKMNEKNFYDTSHLIVAAIRVLEHQNHMPPSIDQLCQMLSITREKANLVCRKLNELGVIEFIEGGFGARLFVRNHMKIEDIPKEDAGENLKESIEKFMDSRKGLDKKIESFQTKQAQKKKELFSEIENKLKKELEKK